MKVELETKTVTLTSKNNKYDICLNQEKDRIIPKGYDVSGIIIKFPEHLLEVRVIIGECCVAVFDRDMQSELSTFPLYLTLSKYNYTKLELVYDKDWISSNEEVTNIEITQEYKKIEELGDEITIWDGYEYHTGKSVTYKEVPTGEYIRKVINGITVQLPTIVFNLVHNNSYDDNLNLFITKTDTYLDVPVKQKIILASIDNDYKEKLIQKYNMNICGEYGIVTSYIRYSHGTATLTHMF